MKTKCTGFSAASSSTKSYPTPMIDQFVDLLNQTEFVIFGFGYSLGVATKNGLTFVETMISRAVGIKGGDDETN